MAYKDLVTIYRLKFDARVKPGWVGILAQARDELSALASFASFELFYPSQRGKTHNCAQYVAAMMAIIQD